MLRNWWPRPRICRGDVHVARIHRRSRRPHSPTFTSPAFAPVHVARIRPRSRRPHGWAFVQSGIFDIMHGRHIFDPDRHHRRSIRKRTHDYTLPGLYFVTFCTHDRQPLFGKIVDSSMVMNANGRIAHEHWHGIPGHYGHVEVHTFTIMPDHVHGVIELTDESCRTGIHPSGRQRPLGPAPGSLGSIIGSYRAGVAREMNRIWPAPIRRPWQRGYYDIIILNDRMLERINGYIRRHPTMVLPDH